jgi:hypothetical protein
MSLERESVLNGERIYMNTLYTPAALCQPSELSE